MKTNKPFDPQLKQMWWTTTPLTTMSNITKDNINPDHYKVGGIEAIDYMQAKSTHEEFTGHLRLTAIKYLSRSGHKDDVLQEYKKALWYIERLVDTVEAIKNNE